jgi:hypothetical protein
METLAAFVLRYTIPLYIGSSVPDDTTIVCGTGILLAVGANRLILTAAHVLELKAREGLNLHFRTKSGAGHPGLSFPVFMSLSKHPKHLDDPIDLGAMVIPDELVKALEVDHLFLTLNQIDPTDVDMRDSSGYVSVGFPSDLSGVAVTAHKARPMILSSVRRDGKISSKRHNPAFHIAIDYIAEYQVEGDQLVSGNLPEPGGMSGCGVWRTVENGRPLSPENVRLVGVVQELIRAERLLVATQIEYGLGLIMRALPGAETILNLYRGEWGKFGWKPRSKGLL